MNDLREVLMQGGGITMYIVFLLLLLIYFAVIAVKEIRHQRKTQDDTSVTEKEKHKGYFQSIAWLWGAALVVFIMCYIGGISLKEIGFRQISFNYGFWFTAVTLTLGGIFFVYILYSLIALLTSAKVREDAIKGTPGSITKYLPRTKKGKWLFSLLAFSAGVCEEIVFRGFLLFLAWSIFPGASLYFVVLIPILLFGTVHFYQGLQGVIRTAIFGTFFICLYLVTDSLVLPMLLHFLGDLVTAFFISEKDIT